MTAGCPLTFEQKNEKNDSNLQKKMKKNDKIVKKNEKKWQNFTIIPATIWNFATMLLKQSALYLS